MVGEGEGGRGEKEMKWSGHRIGSYTKVVDLHLKLFVLFVLLPGIVA